MPVSESMVQDIVKEVVARMQLSGNAGTAQHGVFTDMNQAIEAAKEAEAKVRCMTMDQREQIVSNIRRKTHENAELLARMGVEETGMGNVGDKILKHHLLADKTPGTEDITTTAWSGDRGLTLIEMGPFGVIGAITPCTNPSETVLCNSMGMIAAGNTVVFNPHPQAIKTSIFAINMVNEASLEAGGPDNVACTVTRPTLETGNIMMKHKDIPLIAATGGPGVVTAVLSSGKRGIGAGAGNPPALVDETADVRKAAADIVNGCTFDNNLPCIAEKEIVAVDSVADELMNYMISEQGCYLISKEEQDKLTATVITPKGLNRKCVGRDARTLLSMIGIQAPENIRCIVFEGEKEHPLIAEELMMPILGLVRAKDFDDAVEKAVWLEHGNRHSAHIHSKNVDNITKYAKAIDTAILVKNAPSYAALGFGGEGFCTFTIASRTGEGLTSASTFTKRRRCVMSDSLCIR
ncbi:propionaldehyde dehydrogenase [Lachnospiraceae bacterium NLAE-zl-G231]|nr:propionaldehyde dehydrogenase [Lachnospiraceae bacterium NLAE-zl-G231]